MAKKSTKKKKSTKRKGSKKSGGNNWGLLIGLLGIIVILLIIVSYYYQKDPTNQIAERKETPQSETRETPKERSDNSNSLKEQSSKPQETKPESKETNPDLPDYEDVDEYYFTSSFDFAWPAYDTDDIIVEHEGFTLSYDEKNEQASWVAYRLDKKNLDRARYKRKDNFRADPLVRTGSATSEDYRGSGYDRGHLAPAADFTWSETALDHTFFMSNMSPQEPSFNRGAWKKLEEMVRDWARENNSLYVVTGPIIEKRKGRIGDNKVTIPQYYYKAILDIQEPELKAIGFVMENKKLDQTVMSYAVAIDRIEAMTGLDFFPSIPDEMENQLERTFDESLWK